MQCYLCKREMKSLSAGTITKPVCRGCYDEVAYILKTGLLSEEGIGKAKILIIEAKLAFKNLMMKIKKECTLMELNPDNYVKEIVKSEKEACLKIGNKDRSTVSLQEMIDLMNDSAECIPTNGDMSVPPGFSNKLETQYAKDFNYSYWLIGYS